MGFSSILSGIGKAIAKGGKWALEHSGAIANIAQTGASVFGDLSENEAKKRQAQAEQEYYYMLEEENSNLKNVLQEINEGVSELQNAFETTIDGIEKKYGDLSAELKTLKQEHTETIDSLQNQLTLYKEQNTALQNKMQKQLIMMSVIGGIGIVIAVLLAVLL